MESEREKYREALAALEQQVHRAYDLAEGGSAQRASRRFLANVVPALSEASVQLKAWLESVAANSAPEE